MGLLIAGIVFLVIGVSIIVKKRRFDSPFALTCILGAMIMISIFYSPAWQDFMKVTPLMEQNTE